MTDSVNSSVTAAENIFKDLVYNPGVEAGKAALFAALPWMSVWPISPIVRAIINAYANSFFGTLKVNADEAAIEFLNDKALAAYSDASIKLRVLAIDKGPASPEYIKAREDATKALSVLAQYNR